VSDIKAVLFDMDGTLLAPEEHSSLLEFKARWGIPSDQLIVPNLAKLSPEAYQNFAEIESSLAQHAVLRPGVAEFLSDLRARGIKTALVTNNTVASARTVMTKFALELDAVLTRDDHTMKPAPDMLLSALEGFGLEPHNAVMVGDTRADSGAAAAAGMRHCYLIAEPWNETLEDARTTRVTDFAVLKAALLEGDVVRA
jgi:phosphoglycolate phosphatase